VLANPQLRFRTAPAAANLFPSNALQLAALTEAVCRFQTMRPTPPSPNSLPVVSFAAPAAASAPALARVPVAVPPVPVVAPAVPLLPPPPLAATVPHSGARMLVLCGLPGSGKSTFAALLMRHMPGWLRVSQVRNYLVCQAVPHGSSKYH
jgi:hypothetical protein